MVKTASIIIWLADRFSERQARWRQRMEQGQPASQKISKFLEQKLDLPCSGSAPEIIHSL